MEEYDRWKAASPGEPVPSPVSLPGPDPQPKSLKEGDDKSGASDNILKASFDLSSMVDKMKSIPSSLSWLVTDMVGRAIHRTKGSGPFNFQAPPSPLVSRPMFVP